ncbi:MAG TPA: hypothetical protein EYO83_05490, partial [Gemmatimonadetes bacterium]|nr:hypothetical protein [Gemmatimonadota bacterium]
MSRIRVFLAGQLAALIVSSLLVASCSTDVSTVDHSAFFPAAWRFSGAEEPVTASNGMVVSTDELA